MTGQTHKPNPLLDLAIREAVHQDILECVEDYLAARQARTIADHVGPLVERIIAEVFSVGPATAEPDSVGCSDCGRMGGEHWRHCRSHYSRRGKHDPEEVDESMCGECGRGDGDHTVGCRAGREQDREDAARYAAGIDDADAFCARHCKGRGRKGHHLLCQLGAIEDEEILAKHLGKSPFSEFGKIIQAAGAAPSEMEGDQ